MHFTSNILMISPEKFRANEFTMDDNVFQSRKVQSYPHAPVR